MNRIAVDRPGAITGAADFVASELQDLGQGPFLSRLSSTRRIRRRLAAAVVAGSLTSSALAGASGRRGSRTTNSLPRPGPSLWTEIVPPCSPTRLRTRADLIRRQTSNPFDVREPDVEDDQVGPSGHPAQGLAPRAGFQHCIAGAAKRLGEGIALGFVVVNEQDRGIGSIDHLTAPRPPQSTDLSQPSPENSGVEPTPPCATRSLTGG
jgi:hypothetical protein